MNVWVFCGSKLQRHRAGLVWVLRHLKPIMAKIIRTKLIWIRCLLSLQSDVISDSPSLLSVRLKLYAWLLLSKPPFYFPDTVYPSILSSPLGILNSRIKMTSYNDTRDVGGTSFIWSLSGWIQYKNFNSQIIFTL